MLAILAATVLALLSLLPANSFAFRVMDGPFFYVDGYGNLRTELIATGCTSKGGAIVFLPTAGASLDELVHELAHAYDCIDNGVMDGSPIERPAERPTWVSDYCWLLKAEWFACSVQRYGIHALTVLPATGDRRRQLPYQRHPRARLRR